MAVGTTPRAGAIMVFHSSDESSWPGQCRLRRSGQPDGSVLLITEENTSGLWEVDQRTVTPADMAGQKIDQIATYAAPMNWRFPHEFSPKLPLWSRHVARTHLMTCCRAARDRS